MPKPLEKRLETKIFMEEKTEMGYTSDEVRKWVVELEQMEMT